MRKALGRRGRGAKPGDMQVGATSHPPGRLWSEAHVSAGEDAETSGTHTAWPRGDSVEVPREFKMELPCERALPSLRGYPRETRTCPCNTVRDIHGGVVDNAQGQDGLGRPRGEAEHAMTFFCRKKERSTCAGAPGTPGAQRKKPVTSSHASWATV